MIGEEAYHIQGHLKQSYCEQNERIFMYLCALKALEIEDYIFQMKHLLPF